MKKHGQIAPIHNLVFQTKKTKRHVPRTGSSREKAVFDQAMPRRLAEIAEEIFAGRP